MQQGSTKYGLLLIPHQYIWAKGMYELKVTAEMDRRGASYFPDLECWFSKKHLLPPMCPTGTQCTILDGHEIVICIHHMKNHDVTT
jgi:hypothetical protein